VEIVLTFTGTERHSLSDRVEYDLTIYSFEVSVLIPWPIVQDWVLILTRQFHDPHQAGQQTGMMLSVALGISQSW